MTCDKNPEKIKKMFDEISIYYDNINNIISLGSHLIIKYLSIKNLDIKPRAMILDLCCGTGDFTMLISRFFPRSKVIGLDFSDKMLKIAKSRISGGVFMKGNCTCLPFENNEFDYITMGFGLRNIKDRQKAISEAYRVLDRGGKFLHLDFGKHIYLSKIFDIIVIFFIKLLGKDWESYKYLLESKSEFPEPDKLITEFENSGFKYFARHDYLFGIISAQIMQK